MIRAIIFAIACLASLPWLIMSGTPAWPHDWYSDTKRPDTGTSCCGKTDCAMIPYEAVSCRSTGCDITLTPGSHPKYRGTGTTVVHTPHQPQVSPDGLAHLCMIQSGTGYRVLCLFVGGAV